MWANSSCVIAWHFSHPCIWKGECQIAVWSSECNIGSYTASEEMEKSTPPREELPDWMTRTYPGNKLSCHYTGEAENLVRFWHCCPEKRGCPIPGGAQGNGWGPGQPELVRGRHPRWSLRSLPTHAILHTPHCPAATEALSEYLSILKKISFPKFFREFFKVK